jgi:predicted DNA-binding transcriptional regulator YafY
MSDTPARLLNLLSLLQMPRTWPGDELARRLRVSRRTVRRDVERLRDLGYPVRTAMGAGGGYRLVAGSAMPRCSDWGANSRCTRRPSSSIT